MARAQITSLRLCYFIELKITLTNGTQLCSVEYLFEVFLEINLCHDKTRLSRPDAEIVEVAPYLSFWSYISGIYCKYLENNYHVTELTKIFYVSFLWISYGVPIVSVFKIIYPVVMRPIPLWYSSQDHPQVAAFTWPSHNGLSKAVGWANGMSRHWLFRPVHHSSHSGIWFMCPTSSHVGGNPILFCISLWYSILNVFFYFLFRYVYKSAPV